MSNINLTLFAPDTYPTSRHDIRAYTIAAFRIAQARDQLCLIPMAKPVLDFLVRPRALGYWIEKDWLSKDETSYRLTAQGLVVCQSALAEQLSTHNTTAAQVELWVEEFRNNSGLPRTGSFLVE